MNSKASDVSEGVEPCPFCGSPASTMRGRGWSVACDGGVHDCDVAPETTEFATEAEAIAAWNRRATLSPPLPPRHDLVRQVEILRRALVWHGDRQRMATTREDWQQEVDEAINWVRDNPEDGQPSAPTIADALPSLEVERLRDALGEAVQALVAAGSKYSDQALDVAALRGSAALSALPLDGGLSSD